MSSHGPSPRPSRPGAPAVPATAYPDILPDGPAHRRGAAMNPANRFEAVRLHVLGEHLDHRRANGASIGGTDAPSGLPRVPLEVFADHSRRLINRVVPTSDVPFDWTVSPYRGCEHGCAYCFARPYHEYLGFSCGLDFETKIMAKYDAPKLLHEELAAPSWAGEPIVMSAITDVYQPLEHDLRLTRGCLEVLAQCGQPVSVMTKGALILRDVELLAHLARQRAVRVNVTLPTLDAELAQQLEPRATSPSGRLRVIRELSAAGVPVTVLVAPVIPGLTDKQVPQILKAAAAAGADQAGWVMLRLPHQLKALFVDWLQRFVPDRAARIESLIRQMHNGKLYQSGPRRRRGQGGYAEHVAQMFDVFARRCGLNREVEPLSRASFRKPGLRGQMSLFGP